MGIAELSLWMMLESTYRSTAPMKPPIPTSIKSLMKSHRVKEVISSWRFRHGRGGLHHSIVRGRLV